MLTGKGRGFCYKIAQISPLRNFRAQSMGFQSLNLQPSCKPGCRDILTPHAGEDLEPKDLVCYVPIRRYI